MVQTLKSLNSKSVDHQSKAFCSDSEMALVQLGSMYSFCCMYKVGGKWGEIYVLGVRSMKGKKASRVLVEILSFYSLTWQ